MSNPNAHTEFLLENIDSKASLNNTKLDTIATNTANIKASIEVGGDLFVNVDDLETLQTSANTKLDTIAGRLIDDSNSVAVSNNAINTNVISSLSKLDTIITNTAASSSTGLATEAKQDTGNTSLASIDSKISDTHNKIDAMRGSNSITDLATKLNAGLPSALDSDRLKVRLDADLADTNSKIDAMRGSNSITDLATKLNAGLPSALNSDQLKVSDASTATKLDTIAGRLIDDSNSVAVSNNAINTNVITQNTNFFNKAAFLQASVDAESSPPSGTTEILLTQDVPMQFKMTTLTSSTDAISTNLATTNSKLTTIDTDTGNIDTKLGVLNTTTSANNTLQAAIVNYLTQNGDGTGNAAGVILDAINTNTISQNSKIDSTNTKLDTLEATLTNIETDAAANEVLLTTISSRLIDDSNSVANSNNAINTNTISGNAKLDTIISNTAEISDVKTSIDTMQGDHTLTDLHTLLNGGLPSTLESDKLRCDDEDTHTKLDTIASRLIDDSNSVANSNNAINTNIISQNSKIDSTNTKLDTLEASLTSMESKLDTMITHLATIAGDTTSLDGKLSASNTSGHYGNS